jgi:hypothetical protein
MDSDGAIYRSDSSLVPVWEGVGADGQPEYVGDLLLGVMQPMDSGGHTEPREGDS